MQAAIEQIFPLVYEFRKERTKPVIDIASTVDKKRAFGLAENDPVEDIMYVSDQEELVDGIDASDEDI